MGRKFLLGREVFQGKIISCVFCMFHTLNILKGALLSHNILFTTSNAKKQCFYKFWMHIPATVVTLFCWCW